MSRVLLINDYPPLLVALPVIFTRSPCVIAVDTAASAEQALRLIEATEYDTIVSDFSMPGLNGIEFLKECKAVRPDIPIILLTGYGPLALEEKAFEEGAYAVMQKPVDVDVLFSVVTRASIRRELRQAGTILHTHDSGSDSLGSPCGRTSTSQRLRSGGLVEKHSTATSCQTTEIMQQRGAT